MNNKSKNNTEMQERIQVQKKPVIIRQGYAGFPKSVVDVKIIFFSCCGLFIYLRIFHRLVPNLPYILLFAD